MIWVERELAALVRTDRVDRRVYTDSSIFELEMERIFAVAWLYLGHESQIRSPGDFFTARIGRQRLIVTRHRDGTIHALHNRCAHRGAEVCAKPCGNTKSFVCPYHAWSYDTDGRLASVPLARGYADGLRPRFDELRLEPLARLASYRGFIFGSLAADGPDLESYLGPNTTVAFDNMIDRAPDGEIEIAGGRTVQRYRGNWKLQMENSIDLLHPRILHRNATESIGSTLPLDSNGLPAPDMDFLSGNGMSFAEWDSVHVEAVEQGHCVMGGFLRKIDPSKGFGSDDRMRFEGQEEYKAALTARHGAARAAEILSFNRHNTIIYPNLFINPRLQQIRYVVPIAVDETEQHGFAFRYKGAPQTMFHVAIRILNAANSPASLVTTDDHEVFERIQQNLSSGERRWVDWSRGLPHERPTAHGIAGEGTSELPMRNQFKQWSRMMTAGAT